MNNPWIQFLRQKGGQGYSRDELREMYRAEQYGGGQDEWVKAQRPSDLAAKLQRLAIYSANNPKGAETMGMQLVQSLPVERVKELIKTAIRELQTIQANQGGLMDPQTIRQIGDLLIKIVKKATDRVMSAGGDPQEILNFLKSVGMQLT